MSELEQQLQDAMVPGFQVTVDPHNAELAGAFAEDAISEQDALESAVDLALVQEVQ